METIEISSLQNEIVKYCTKLQNSKFRKTQKVILLDGRKTIEGLINDNFEFEYLFLKKGDILSESAKTKKLVYVNDPILKKISTTQSPSSVVGIIKEIKYTKEDFLNLDKIILLDGIKDAGNLGTIIRSAAAFSLDGIILYNNCVDVFNPKVIRSSAQNMFKIPIIHTCDIDFIRAIKNTHEIISTVVNSDNDFLKYKFPSKFVLAFGSEANGLSDEIIKVSNKKITLKMDNNVESLNLAVFASISFAILKLRL